MRARGAHSQSLAAARRAAKRKVRSIDLAEAIARAKADFVVTAARRLNQLAVGGVIQLPDFDKENNPLRDKDGALIVTEKAMLPNANAFMYILDRVDPQPREPEDGPQFERRS